MGSLTVTRITTAKPERRERLNDQRIIRLICAEGPQSRLEMGIRLGLSAPTIAKTVGSLLRSRLLEEVEEEAGPSSLVGRPPKKLRLSRYSAQILGIVIAPARCWVVASGLDGELREDQMLPLNTPEHYDLLIDRITERARELMERSAIPTLGVGICVPGLVNLRTHESVMSANVPFLRGKKPAHDLGQRLGLTAVTLQAKHALCLAESHFGTVQGQDDFLMLDFSTGVGMGMVTNGQLIRGKNGFAGEVGHMTVEPEGPSCGCGNLGCLETLVSDTAIAARMSQKRGRSLDIEDVVVLFRDDPSALDQEIALILKYLPIALATLINTFNPAYLYLHGRLFDLGEDLIPRVLETTRRRALEPAFAECRVSRASGNKRLGALAAIRQHLIDSLAAPVRETAVY